MLQYHLNLAPFHVNAIKIFFHAIISKHKKFHLLLKYCLFMNFNCIYKGIFNFIFCNDEPGQVP